MVITITSGAHWRDTSAPQLTGGPFQYAHIFDPDSPEDVPHEAHNFITYAAALGNYIGPHILLRPDTTVDWDKSEWDEIEVMMSDWREIVESATHIAVEIR